MSEQTVLPLPGTSNTPQNGEENPNKEDSSKLITRDKIPNTPFTIIGNYEHGYFIAMGKMRITEPKPTPLEAIQEIEDIDYNIILRMIIGVVEMSKNL